VSDELVPPTEMVRSGRVEPDRIGAVCSCGWGYPAVEPYRVEELHLDYARHLAQRHPEASGYLVTLILAPNIP
jgi:hypothetical protein